MPGLLFKRYKRDAQTRANYYMAPLLFQHNVTITEAQAMCERLQNMHIEKDAVCDSELVHYNNYDVYMNFELSDTIEDERVCTLNTQTLSMYVKRTSYHVCVSGNETHINEASGIFEHVMQLMSQDLVPSPVSDALLFSLNGDRRHAVNMILEHSMSDTVYDVVSRHVFSLNRFNTTRLTHDIGQVAVLNDATTHNTRYWSKVSVHTAYSCKYYCAKAEIHNMFGSNAIQNITYGRTLDTQCLLYIRDSGNSSANIYIDKLPAAAQAQSYTEVILLLSIPSICALCAAISCACKKYLNVVNDVANETQDNNDSNNNT